MGEEDGGLGRCGQPIPGASAIGRPQAVCHHRALGLLQRQGLLDPRRIERLAVARPIAHRQQLPGQPQQLRGGQPAMAFAARLQQGVVQPRPQANHGVGGDAQPGRNRIGGAEADAADIARQPVRVFRHHLHGVIPIRFEDAHRPRRSHPMAVQKHHDLPHHLLIRPGPGDAPRPHLADARHLPQPLRRLLDHRKHLLPEGIDQLAGIDRPDAADHAAPQILRHPLRARGGGGAQEGGLELQAVLPIVHPLAGDGDPFPGADLRRMAHHRHQLAMAAGLHPQYAKAIGRTVEGDPLNQPCQHLAGRLRCRSYTAAVSRGNHQPASPSLPSPTRQIVTLKPYHFAVGWHPAARERFLKAVHGARDGKETRRIAQGERNHPRNRSARPGEGAASRQAHPGTHGVGHVVHRSGQA